MSQELAFQDAVVRLLRADAAVKALVASRIYDRVPLNAARPYVSIGPSQMTQQDFDCVDGAECFLQVDVWSSEPGFAQCKTLAAAVRKALHNAAAEQDGFTFEIEHRFTNEFRDADGLTSHGVISLRAIIDQ